MPLTPRQSIRKEWLEKAIDAIQETQLNGIVSEGSQMTFNGRSIQRFSPDELERLRLRFEAELTKFERIELGTHTRTIRVIG